MRPLNGWHILSPQCRHQMLAVGTWQSMPGSMQFQHTSWCLGCAPDLKIDAAAERCDWTLRAEPQVLTLFLTSPAILMMSHCMSSSRILSACTCSCVSRAADVEHT